MNNIFTMNNFSILLLVLSLLNIIILTFRILFKNNSKNFKRKNEIIYKIINYIIIYLGIYFLNISKELAGARQECYNFSLEIIFIEFIKTIQYFLASIDYNDMFVCLKHYCAPFYSGLSNCLSFTYSVISVIAGISVILTIIKDFIPKFYLLCNSKVKRYVFSELNEMSIEIARKISNNNHNKIIIFCNCNKENNKFYSRAKQLNAICFKEHIDSISINCFTCIAKIKTLIYKLFNVIIILIYNLLFKNLCILNDKFNIDCNNRTTKSIDKVNRIRNYSIETNFWLISYDEKQNNIDAISNLYNKKHVKLFKKMDRVNIFVYDNSLNNNFNIDELYKSKLDSIYEKINIVVTNEYRNVVYNLLYNDETALYNYIKQDDNGELSILILGYGLVGKEFLKACSWSGQLGRCLYSKDGKVDGFQKIDLKINVVSYNKENPDEELFKQEMPGFTYEQFGRELVDVKFHNKKFGTSSFDENVIEIIKKDKPTYVVIALGDDETNYKAASHISKLLIQHSNKKFKTLINYFIDNYEYYETITSNNNNSMKEVERSKITQNCISNFAISNQNYCFDDSLMVYFNESLFNLALKVHLKYEGGSCDFNMKDKNNRKLYFDKCKRFLSSSRNVYSSLTSVIHAKYKSYVLGFIDICKDYFKNYKDDNVCNKFYESTSKYANEWGHMEHCKWSAFTYSDGYLSAKNKHVINYLLPKNTTKWVDGKIHVNLVSSKVNSSDYYLIMKLLEIIILNHNPNYIKLLIEEKLKLNINSELYFEEFVNDILSSKYFDFITDETLSINECIERNVISKCIIDKLDSLDKTSLVLCILNNNFTTKEFTNTKYKDQDFTIIPKKEENLKEGEIINNSYLANPIDTSKIKLDESILELAELLAKNTHDVWALGKIKEGWTYGPKIDSNLKQHPSLIEYEELSEEQKDYDRNTSLETLKVLIALGFEIIKK